MDVEAYLERIGYRGGLAPTAETLRRLHVAHLLTVPFENLSIHAGEPIVLEDALLFDKVVARRRGGFCYELNGLFAALLRALGFRVEMLSAAVARREGGFGPEFDHMALLVTLEERWLADVGFGDSFAEPLLVDERAEQRQGPRAFRVDGVEGGRLLLLRRDAGGAWEPQYRFGLEPHAYAEYEEMCRLQQTSPESHFTRGRVCSRLTNEGRVTLSGTRLIETKGGGKEERELLSEEECAAALLEHFGISMRGGDSNP
ncbi:MAG: arylamine N-acetyltransferase family protein [Pyrinomonadaceae bacterium]